MKKMTGLTITLLLAGSLLTGCGGEKPVNGNESGGKTTSPSGFDSSTPSETAPQSETGSDAVKSGKIGYKPDELLQSYCDYVYGKGKEFEEIFNNTEALMSKMDLAFALLDRDHLAFIPTCDEYGGSGTTIFGDAVTKKTNSDETTWELQKETESDMGPNYKKGDIEKIFISLNTRTDTLFTEQTRLRGSSIISKTVNRVVALSDGTILSEYYSAGPDGKGESTVTVASLFKYNAEKKDFEMLHGEFINVAADFTAPECLNGSDFDKDKFLAFANEVGTVKVIGGKCEIITP